MSEAGLQILKCPAFFSTNPRQSATRVCRHLPDLSAAGPPLKPQGFSRLRQVKGFTRLGK
jgi:hypothetical protein